MVRDGKPYPPAALDELEIYPDAAGALARLKQAGYLLIVVTNQPDVARGTQTRDAWTPLTPRSAHALPIDEFLVCWHDDRDGCDCRKPKPGWCLRQPRHRIDLAQSFLIGDRWRDIECGAAAGVRTVLIDRHYRERAPAFAPGPRRRIAHRGGGLDPEGIVLRIWLNGILAERILLVP